MEALIFIKENILPWIERRSSRPPLTPHVEHRSTSVSRRASRKQSCSETHSFILSLPLIKVRKVLLGTEECKNSFNAESRQVRQVEDTYREHEC